MKYLLTLYLILFSLFSIVAQESDVQFEHISIEQGLSQSSVYAILRDSKGFMWFGTLDGLNMYDGYEITKYRHNPADSFSIADNSINVLFEDKDKTIWIGTQTNGLCKYDRITNRFYNYKHNPSLKNSISHNNITSIIEDNEGFLWIGTKAGLNKFDKQKQSFVSFLNVADNPNSLSNNNINDIAIDNFFHLWIATNDGLNKFTPETGSFHVYKNIADTVQKNNPDNRRVNRVNCLYFDRNGDLWIGSNNGLTKRIIRQGETRLFTYFSYEKKQNSISDNAVTTITQDSEGNLWIGTEKGGLNKLNPETEQFIHYKYDESKSNSLSSNHVLTLYHDKTNILWIGTYLGGINKWSHIAKDLQVYKHDPYSSSSIASNQVRTIFQDKAGSIWIGTVDKGLEMWDRETNSFIHFQHKSGNKNSISNNHVRTILEDNNGNFWIGTDGGGINLFDRKKKTFTHYRHDDENSWSLSNDRVWKIYQDSRENIWVATYGGGLNLFYPDRNIFVAFKNAPGDSSSLSDNNVTTILEDHKGLLWIGTMQGLNKGIVPRADLSTGYTISFNVYQYSSSDTNSIGDNRIYSIVEDSEKNLWIGTKGKLNKFDRKSNSFIKYSETDGFPNDVFMGILEDSNNYLWISTNGGLSRFNPKTDDIRNYSTKDGLQSNEFLVGSFCKASDGEMFFGGIKGFNSFYPENIKDNPNIPSIVITNFQIRNKEVKMDSSISEKHKLQLSYKDDVITFEFVALDYVFPEKNQYAYKMEGFDREWIEFGTKRYISYTNLPPGEYIFRVRGSNNDGVWNKKGTYINISISPPFWKTKWFILLCLGLAVSVIILYIKFRERKLQRAKRKLEKTVVERTAEIVRQKEAIEQKNTALEQQKSEIQQQKDKIEQAYTNINVLSEIGMKVTASLLAETIIETVYKNINILIDAPIFAIGVIDEENNRLDFTGSKENGKTLPHFFHQLDNKYLLSAYCFNKQEDILIADYEKEYQKYFEESITPFTDKYSRSILYLPLKVKSKKIGVITVQSFHKNAYSDYHLNILKNLAVYVAIALDNASAYKQIEKQNKEITEQRDKITIRNDELKKANLKIKESAELKQIFLANMSHEIRTPLNAINGYTNLMLNSQLDEKQRKYASNIKVSAKNLLVLINDILDLSKIEAGKLTIERIDFDFVKTIENFFNTILIKANEKNIEMQCSISRKIPRYLKGDPYRLNQILTNLVGNSIKFTQTGGRVKIDIMVKKEQNRELMLVFTVIDTGIGIAKGKLESIFESFTQASSDTSRKYGGTGLGLSIVKQLVELQNGQIFVESKENQGTEFCFTLYYDKARKATSEQTVDFNGKTIDKLNNIKILLVEDNAINREIAIDTIHQYNSTIHVDCAANGKIAIKKLVENQYDIVIMDIQMPEMDGYETTKYIRNRMEMPVKQIPILGMSAHAMKTEKEKCLNLGMDDYITKPFEPENLFGKIETCIQKKQPVNNIENYKNTQPAFLSEIKTEYINLNYLPEIYTKNKEKALKILSMCHNNIPADLQKINTLLKTDEYKAISGIAHSLKSLMYYLGLINLREILIKIEKYSKFEENTEQIPGMVANINKLWEKAKDELKKVIEQIKPRTF